MDISVIVPIYNEERRIATALFELNSYLESHFNSFEIIVIDDASEDGTRNVLKELPFASIRAFSFSQHHGRGGAVRYGCEQATPSDYVIVYDADLSVSPTVIETLVQTARDADSPFVFTPPVATFNGYYRRLSPYWYQNLASALLGVARVSCGTKCLLGSFARKVVSKTKTNSLGFDTELIYLAREFDFIPIEVMPAVGEQGRKGRENFSLFGILTLLRIRRLATRGAYSIEKIKEWGGNF